MNKIKKLFSLVLLCDKYFIFFSILHLVLSFLLVIIQIYFPKFIAEQMLHFHKGDKVMEKTVILIFVFVLIKFSDKLLKNIIDKRKAVISKRCEFLINEKVMKVPYDLLENKEFSDKVSNAVHTVKNYKALENIIENIEKVSLSSLIIGLSVIYLLKNNFVLLIIVIAGGLIQSYISETLNTVLNPYFKKLYKINRKFDWFFSLKSNLAIQKDARIFQTENMIMDKMKENNRETIKTFLKMNNLTAENEIKIKILNILVLGFSYLYTSLKVFGILGSKISIGEFVFLNMLTLKLNDSIFDLMKEKVSLNQMINYLIPVFEIIECNYSEKDRNEILNKIEKIEFKEVSYKYPNSEEIILDNISFEINQGEVIGIVGLNGAGKSTLIKLLCGFYTPVSGEILINGKNIKKYTHNSLLKELSAVFQDFRLFNFTLEENILSDNEKNERKFKKIISDLKCGEIINSFKYEEKTLLGTQLDKEGVDLSGGEQQKIATVRALYKNSSVIIFDEPASKLDPIMEYETYKLYMNSIKDRITFFISHRVVTTSFCNRIMVLDKGKISDFDTYENLMKNKKSLYRKMYSEQYEMLKNTGF